jgi:hypothetical protein
MVELLSEWTAQGGTETPGYGSHVHRMEYLEGAKRRIFDGVSAPQTRILGLIKEEMKLCDLACGGGDPGV